MSTGHSCRVSDFLWLVTESTLLPPEQIFTQIEKNISKSFRRNLRELSNNAMSLQLSPRNIFWLVTESTLLPLEHIFTQIEKNIFKYFRRSLTKLSNSVITIATKKYFLTGHQKVPCCHSCTFSLKIEEQNIFSIFSSTIN